METAVQESHLPPPSAKLTRQRLHTAHVGGTLFGPGRNKNCDGPKELRVRGQANELVLSLVSSKVLNLTENPE